MKDKNEMDLEETVSKDITENQIMEGFSQYINEIPQKNQTWDKIKHTSLSDIGMSLIYCLNYAGLILRHPGVIPSLFKKDKTPDKWVESCEKAVKERYAEAGCTTELERKALDIACLSMQRLDHIYLNMARKNADHKVEMTKKEFEENVYSSILQGVNIKEGELFYEGLDNPEGHVYKDFAKKTQEWLCNEIYSRAENGNKIKLLDEFSIKVDNEGTVYLD